MNRPVLSKGWPGLVIRRRASRSFIQATPPLVDAPVCWPLAAEEESEFAHDVCLWPPPGPKWQSGGASVPHSRCRCGHCGSGGQRFLIDREVFADADQPKHLPAGSLEIEVRIGNFELLDAEGKDLLFGFLDVVRFELEVGRLQEVAVAQGSVLPDETDLHVVQLKPVHFGGCRSDLASQDIAIKLANGFLLRSSGYNRGMISKDYLSHDHVLQRVEAESRGLTIVSASNALRSQGTPLGMPLRCSRDGSGQVLRDPRVLEHQTTAALLDQVLQAEQVHRPLGGAVVHDLVGLAPSLMTEQDDGLIVVRFDAENDLSVSPVLERPRVAPLHEAGIRLHHIQASAAEVEAAALRSVSVSFGPPTADAVGGRERLEDARRRGGDADAMKNVEHF